MTFMKGATSAFTVDGFHGNFMPWLFSLVVIAGSLMQLWYLNISMKIYDQLDSIPIF
jgi:hypothetical protein